MEFVIYQHTMEIAKLQVSFRPSVLKKCDTENSLRKIILFTTNNAALDFQLCSGPAKYLDEYQWLIRFCTARVKINWFRNPIVKRFAKARSRVCKPPAIHAMSNKCAPLWLVINKTAFVAVTGIASVTWTLCPPLIICAGEKSKWEILLNSHLGILRFLFQARIAILISPFPKGTKIAWPYITVVKIFYWHN